MKTFVRLVPAPHETGRFFCPRSPNGAGLQLTSAGIGVAWWKPSDRIDPELLLQFPSALANLVLTTFESQRLTLWVKFPWRAPLERSLLIVISLRRNDGTFLNLGWSPQIQSRADAVDFLVACPGLDGAWIGEDQALLDQRHGRIVSIEHYSVSGLTETFDREAA
jgi:hypothetical protein